MNTAQVRVLGTARDQRGSATVEVALLVPALLITLGLLAVGGRIWFARTTVNEAASSAARAASLARSAGEASTAGRDAAARSLGTEGLRCTWTAVDVSTGAFAVPAGTPATVTTSVRCRVAYADLILPVVPGGIELEASGASALDTYRSR